MRKCKGASSFRVSVLALATHLAVTAAPAMGMLMMTALVVSVELTIALILVICVFNLDVCDRVAPGDLHQPGAIERPGKRHPFAAWVANKQLSGSWLPLFFALMDRGVNRR